MERLDKSSNTLDGDISMLEKELKKMEIGIEGKMDKNDAVKIWTHF